MSLNKAIDFFVNEMRGKYLPNRHIRRLSKLKFEEDKLRAIHNTRKAVKLDQDVVDDDFVLPAFQILEKEEEEKVESIDSLIKMKENLKETIRKNKIELKSIQARIDNQINKDHYKIWLLGVETWNEWRERNPKIKPNLAARRFSKLDLRGFNLRGVILTDATLTDINLAGVNLCSADFSGVKMIRVNLQQAYLHAVKLRYAYLSHVDITGADMLTTITTGTDMKNVIKDSWKDLPSRAHRNGIIWNLCYDSDPYGYDRGYYKWLIR